MPPRIIYQKHRWKSPNGWRDWSKPGGGFFTWSIEQVIPELFLVGEHAMNSTILVPDSDPLPDKC
jgi:hypothetical protein